MQWQENVTEKGALHWHSASNFLRVYKEPDARLYNITQTTRLSGEECKKHSLPRAIFILGLTLTSNYHLHICWSSRTPGRAKLHNTMNNHANQKTTSYVFWCVKCSVPLPYFCRPREAWKLEDWAYGKLLHVAGVGYCQFVWSRVI